MAWRWTNFRCCDPLLKSCSRKFNFFSNMFTHNHNKRNYIFALEKLTFLISRTQINYEKKCQMPIFFSVSSEPNFQLPQFWIFPSWKFKSKFNHVSWNYFASHIFNWASSLCGIITHRRLRTLKMLKRQHMTIPNSQYF